MSNTIDETEPASPAARGRWGRRLSVASVVLLLLLLGGYLLLSSESFFKGIILPRVSKSLHGQITIAHASISPFSKVILHQLKIQTTGSEPVLVAEEVRVRYRLLSLLAGNLNVQELTLTAPKLQIVQNADGTQNLDPLLATVRANKPPRASVEKSPTIALRNVSISQGSVRLTVRRKDGSRDLTEVSDINVTLDRLQNAGSGTLNLAAALSTEQIPPGSQTTATNNLLQAKLSGAYEFDVDLNLLPQTVKGSARFNVSRGQGDFTELAGLDGILECELTPKELRQLTLRFERGGKNLGRLQVRGPLEMARSEGRLVVEVSSIDRQVLNLFGSKHNLEFGESVLNSKSTVEIGERGTRFTIDGKLTGERFVLKQHNISTPPLDLELTYQVNLNLSEKSALIRAFRIQVQQESKDLITGRLDRPMNLSWGIQSAGFKESSFQMTVTNLNLADWRGLMGESAPSGKANLTANVLSQQDGKHISFDLTSQLQGLSARWGTNQIEQAQLQIRLNGTLEQYRRLHLDSYNLDGELRGQTVVNAQGSASYNLENQDLALQTSLEVSLPRALEIYPQPGLTAKSGSVKFSGLVESKGEKKNVSGNLVFADLTARYADYDFQNHQISCDYQLERERSVWRVPRFSMGFRQGYEPGGSLDVTGEWDEARNSGQFTFKSIRLNQVALRPFLAPKLAPNKLVSASLSADGSVVYHPEAESTLKGSFNLGNLQVDDPEKKFPPEPLSAELQMEGSLRQSTLDLQRLLLTLSATPRAKNSIEIQGRLDFAKTNPAPSHLSLRSQSLDATRYYELFSGTSKTNIASDRPRPAPIKSKPEEPEPIALPLGQLTFDANIAEFYLKDIAITNWLATAKINQGKVSFDPFKLTMNGAPISAKAELNLSVPGYIYDLTVAADQLPVQPLWSSFSRDSATEYQGYLSLNTRLKGAGVTGTSLQKSLSGQFSLNLTNASIQLLSPKARRLITPVALVLGVPELADAPLNAASLRAEMGGGKIDVKQMKFLSEAFYADAQGVIRIANVLTNSPLNLPVNLALQRSLAQRANLVPSDTPTNTAFVRLPSFVKIAGTLGDPKADIDKVALTGLLLQSAGGISTLGGDKTANILNGLGDLLSGKPRTVPGTSTNATPGTNSNSKTNKPAQSLPFDLLNDLLKKKK